MLLKIQPSDYVLHAPLDGDVTATSSTSIELIGWDQQVYQLLLTSSAGHCDWQVRVGDHVTPVGILGTLSSDTAATAILTCSRHRPTSDATNADYLPTLGY
ncbi:hypothetical protein ACFFLI_06155 [Lactiplantibacillus modestisalitolerans]|uniref:Uncharacterized protein n=2 Tax=Lactiplantibacillus modestisalitolerans TaxID=1457219 RepID=A0ABV5WU64_9LACO